MDAGLNFFDSAWEYHGGVSEECLGRALKGKPSESVPQGRPTGMRVQLVSHGERTREYAVIFGKGDETFSGMLDFTEKYHITSAHFAAIGALNGATLAWFDPQRKMYKTIPIDGQIEVISMICDIALYQGKPVVHAHIKGWRSRSRTSIRPTTASHSRL